MKAVKYIYLLFSFFSFSQEVDYSEYHKKINKAEELFFMQNKVDSSLYYYDKAFKEYNFIFVKDLVNAAQIAIFNKKPFEEYLEKGFSFGLKFSHLYNYPLFNDYINSISKSSKKKLKIYLKQRAKYLKKIDFEYLDTIYKIAIKDQLEKKSKTYFNIEIKKATDNLFEIIQKKGFPGEKIIGLSDSLIFKEIGKPELDLSNQISNNINLQHMTSEEEYLASKYPIILLLHNPCSFKLYANKLKEEIKKGNLHPRDFGLIYDNIIRFDKRLPNYCDNIKIDTPFLLNRFSNYDEFTDILAINKLRSEYCIVSLELDKVKIEYEDAHGFKLFSGFWNCR